MKQEQKKFASLPIVQLITLKNNLQNNMFSEAHMQLRNSTFRAQIYTIMLSVERRGCTNPLLINALLIQTRMSPDVNND